MAAAAILKNPKTPYLGRGSNDFDEIWHTDALITTCPGIGIALEGGSIRRERQVLVCFMQLS